MPITLCSKWQHNYSPNSNDKNVRLYQLLLKGIYHYAGLFKAPVKGDGFNIFELLDQYTCKYTCKMVMKQGT